jgi:hypothetical protein
MDSIRVQTVRRVVVGGLLLLLLMIGVAPAQAQNGTVSGHITRASDNSDLAGILVRLYTDEGELVAESSPSASDGTYLVPVLPGTYYAKTASYGQPFINEVYNDIPCIAFCFLTLGDAIAVVADTTTEHIDFALSEGGQISGTIRNASTNEPLADVVVEILNNSGFPIESITTSATGVYTSSGLSAGSYYLQTTSNPAGLVNEVYDGANGFPCLPFCSAVDDGAPVEVIGTAITSGIDFSLGQGGTVTGTITNAANVPLSGVIVSAYDASSSFDANPIASSIATGVDGTYTISGLLTDSYLLKTSHPIPGNPSSIPSTLPAYPDEVYPDIICLLCDLGVGTPVSVTFDEETPGINFVLGTGGRIAGTVTNRATGTPVGEVQVQFVNSVGDRAGAGATNAFGIYFSSALPPGSYFVTTTGNDDGLINQLYDNIDCTDCSPINGAPVVVQVDAVAVANFSLAVGGQITGTIKDAATTNPLEDVGVIVEDGTGNSVGNASTDHDGVYTITGLKAGSYFVHTDAFFASESYVNQVYGSAVVVTPPGSVTGIDFNLVIGGSITGTVTNLGGTPLDNVSLQLTTGAGQHAGSADTDASGDFTINGLAAGAYYLRTYNNSGYLDVVYDGGSGAICRDCVPSESGSPIAVTLGETAPAITLALTPGKTISGTITDQSTHLPIQSVGVQIYSATGFVASGFTNSSGAYTASGLPAGVFYARASSFDGGYIDQLWDNLVCPACDPEGSTPIDLTGPAMSATANFAMTRGASVSGTVTDFGTGLPVRNAFITITSFANPDGTGATSNDAGVFTVSGLVPGTYFANVSASGYIPQIYNGIPCGGESCEEPSGTPFTVVAGAPTTGINFALRVGGRITGRITDASSAGIEGVDVAIYDVDGNYFGGGTTSATGTYAVIGLPSGSYVAKTDNSLGYIDEMYDDLTCLACEENNGRRIEVNAGATTPGIDFSLARGGRISGIVTAAGGGPLVDVTVSIADSHGTHVSSVRTDTNGVYISSGLPSGTYFVRTSVDRGGYVDQVYSHLTCGSSCDSTDGSPVSVFVPSLTTGVDFALVRGGSVSGRVTDAANSNPATNGLAGVTMSINNDQDESVGTAVTDSNGNYTISGLPGGTYWAFTAANTGFINQLYDGLACPACDINGGTPIAVTVGVATPGINFALVRGGGISGTVTDAGSGVPIGAVNVIVFNAGGALMLRTTTSANGEYRTADGLPAGTYFLTTSNELGYADALYNGSLCVDCTVTDGTPVVVTGTDVTANINFSLIRGGQIRGTITRRDTNAPIEGVDVQVYAATGVDPVASAVTNGLGGYRTVNIPPGNYYVRTVNGQGFIDGLYNGRDCLRCNPALGTPVSVTSNTEATGIDLSLAVGSHISGTVTVEGGAPAPFVDVLFSNPSGALVASATTNAQGHYLTQAGLPPGTYYSNTDNLTGLINEIYDNVVCRDCSTSVGRPIIVTPGADTTGIDYQLAIGGRISGIVTDRSSPPVPLANMEVEVYASNGEFASSGMTSNSGRYTTFDGLPAGTYYVTVAGSHGFVSALYKLQAAAPHSIDCLTCSPLTGSPVTVTANATTTDIDLALSVGGRITGTVTNAAGIPLDEVDVDVFDADNQFIDEVVTDRAGRYILDAGLPAGSYYATTFNRQGYINRVYNNTDCVGCLANSGAPIAVTAGSTTTGIDFQLPAGGRISGSVTEALTGQVVDDVFIDIYDVSGKVVSSGFPDNLGFFFITTGLQTGTYYALAVPDSNASGHVQQLYSNTSCVSCDPTRGTPIGVTAGNTTTGVNFAIPVGGRVSGRVTSTATGAGIGNVEVLVYSGQGALIADEHTEIRTNADGDFVGRSIPPGNYLVRTRNRQGLVDEAFDNVACAPCPMSAATATPITVTASTTTSGINFTLDAGGLVSGVVTNAATDAPVPDVTVSFFQSGVFKGRSQATDFKGYYAISLPAGSYSAVPDAIEGFRITATPVIALTVTTGAETPNISFQLLTCMAPTISPTSLPLMTAGQAYSQALTATGGTGPYSFSVSAGTLAPGLTLNAATGVISGTPSVSGTASFTVAATDSLGCAGTVAYTPFACSVSVGTTQATHTNAVASGSVALVANSIDCAWTATSNAPWLTPINASGTGSTALNYNVAANPSASVFRSGTITVADKTFTVIQGAAITAAPFGAFDTPNTVATLSGSIAVTGWALDDLSVSRVELWRDRVPGETTAVAANGKIFIANPLFISGARPDVAAAFASYPFADRAGWGYLMLTQGLWNQGNGVYTLYAYAVDLENHYTTLGSKTITVDNANATKPFGSIDVPAFGQTMSGGFWNFGWGLTPGSSCMITNGNVQVGIDSQPLTPVNYGDLRADIAAAFPGFTNGGGAGGAYFIDTTTLTNGVHQIGWLITDNCGRAEGVGSRFFTVANATSTTVLQPGDTVSASGVEPLEGITSRRVMASLSEAEVTVQIDGGNPVALSANANGMRLVKIKQGSRIRLQLPNGSTHTAYQVANGAQAELPLGSSYDAGAGAFYWEPAAGYLGSYDMTFVAVDGSAILLRVIVSEQ